MTEQHEQPMKPGYYCEQCKTQENVIYDEDPFLAEIKHDHTPHWLCVKCREQNAMDI